MSSLFVVIGIFLTIGLVLILWRKFVNGPFLSRIFYFLAVISFLVSMYKEYESFSPEGPAWLLLCLMLFSGFISFGFWFGIGYVIASNHNKKKSQTKKNISLRGAPPNVYQYYHSIDDTVEQAVLEDLYKEYNKLIKINETDVIRTERLILKNGGSGYHSMKERDQAILHSSFEDLFRYGIQRGYSEELIYLFYKEINF